MAVFKIEWPTICICTYTGQFVYSYVTLLLLSFHSKFKQSIEFIAGNNVVQLNCRLGKFMKICVSCRVEILYDFQRKDQDQFRNMELSSRP